MKIPQAFIDYLEKNCYVNPSTGNIHCNKCKNIVIIDWFEKHLECMGCDEL